MSCPNGSSPAPTQLGWQRPGAPGCGGPRAAARPGPANWTLSAVGLAGRAAWQVPYPTESRSGANSFELVHDGLTAGMDHVLTVQGGESGCLSAAGDLVEPFSITFPVVERPE